MNDIQVFTSSEFGQLQVLTVDGKQFFPASECARVLGYTNPHKAIADHCRSLTKREVPHPQSPDKTIFVNFIPEGDLYRLIMRSKLPAAERFESWVVDEVLPAIHNHGVYMTPETMKRAMRDPQFIIDIATELQAEQEKTRVLSAQIAADAPKVLFADSVATSKTTILIGELAKILKGNGVNIGQNRLFAWMRENGYRPAASVPRKKRT